MYTTLLEMSTCVLCLSSFDVGDYFCLVMIVNINVILVIIIINLILVITSKKGIDIEYRRDPGKIVKTCFMMK